MRKLIVLAALMASSAAYGDDAKDVHVWAPNANFMSVWNARTGETKTCSVQGDHVVCSMVGKGGHEWSETIYPATKPRGVGL